MKEINEDRQAHGKKPFDKGSGSGEVKQRDITASAPIGKRNVSKRRT